MITDARVTGITGEVAKIAKNKGGMMAALLTHLASLLVKTTRLIKNIDAEKEKDIRALKIKYDLAKAPHDEKLKELNLTDKALRIAILGCTPNRLEPIRLDDGSVISFTPSWAATLENIKDVPDEYIKTVIDEAKIKEAIDCGIRHIDGVKIEQVRSLTVTPAKIAQKGNSGQNKGTSNR